MSPKNLSLKHLIRPSQVGLEKPSPLFLLHGYGSNEDDLFSFATELPKELFIISVRAPYPLQPFGFAWYAINFDAEQGKWSDNEQAISSRDKIRFFIEEACEKYALDTNNVSLLGFSQGSILSYALALSYPDKIKNVVALSGYINEDVLKKGFESNDFSQLSVYASHGSVDAVIPVEWARRISHFLNGLDITHKYEEFPVGHGVTPQNFYSLRNWLHSHI